MSRGLLGERYGPLIRVPPLLVMDAVFSGRLVLGDPVEFPALSAMLHSAVLLICAVLFFLRSSTLHLCYGLMITMTALRMSQWWNGLFLQKLGMENITSSLANHTTLSPFAEEGKPHTLDVMCSDEFLFYLCIQLMYSFVFTKTPALLSVSRVRDSEAPVLSIWICLVSPVFLHLFLNTVPLLSPIMTSDLIKSFYSLYPILPILLLNVVWSFLSFLYYYMINVRVIVRTYAQIYSQFGIQVLVENQWIRLRVPMVLRLFWLTRFGLYVGKLVLHHHYESRGNHTSDSHVHQTFLHEAFYEIAVDSCSTILAVLGLSATISPIANAIGTCARLFLGGDRDGGENIGTVASVLFFILALQTGLPDLTPENRVVRLGRNMSLLSTAILHFIHTMLNGVMMQLSTNHIIKKQKHARAIIMAVLLIVLPIWFIVHLWMNNPLGTWILALTAFCLELIVKVIVTLVVYVLFLIDTQSDTFWESLDDYVYYVKATGSTIEFVSGLFLFVNGAWIFVFESRGVIRAFMICIHAYFNIFQLGKDGWKKFKNRRMAVQKIQLMDQAAPEVLASHNDVCAICYQELTSACITPCSHLFHAMCLRKWLYVQDSCPLCHKEIMVTSDSSEEQVPPELDDEEEGDEED